MVLHARIDSAGAVDLLGEHQPCQLMGHGDAAHTELEGSGLFTSSDRPWDEPMTKATSPAPLPARCARNCASSSEEICLPSMHIATIAAPLRTLERMAFPPYPAPFSPRRPRRFLLDLFLRQLKDAGRRQRPPDTSGTLPRPRRNIWRSAYPQIRSIFCMTASSFQDKRFKIVSASL